MSKPTKSSDPAAKPERRRRSHLRTFTGCQQCRRRHVKCDESRPTCENCNRMGIECAAYPFKIDMRVYTPKKSALDAGPKTWSASTSTKKLSSLKKEESTSSSEGAENLTMPSNGASFEQYVSDDEVDDSSTPGQLVLIPTPNGLKSSSVRRSASERFFRLNSTAPLIHMRPSDSLDSKFFMHYLSTVSSLLIVYDNPHNANPYRLAFPSLAKDSIPLQQAMNALGALHLANTTQSSREVNLKAMALTRYSDCVHGLRRVLTGTELPTLADLATVLLLTFFEMMDSDTNNWQTHLRGAKDIFERIFSASASAQAENSHKDQVAVRNFLVSALGYLDVAAAASSARPTQLQGAYWDRVGRGWQYNLGVPSLNATIEGRVPEDNNLSQIRAVWSKLMTIIADIGQFATEVETNLGVYVPAKELSRRTLDERLKVWYSDLPEIFNHLNDQQCDYDADSVEGAACVICYWQASIIYFHQVAGTSDQHPHLMDNAICIILNTFQRYGHGVSQMGMLWAFFIAGTEVKDLIRQDYVRARMQAMLSFGMGNVKRALQLLELVWMRRSLPAMGMDVRWFAIQKELQWSLLLP